MHVRNALRALFCILAQTLSTPSVHIQTGVRPLLSTLHLERARARTQVHTISTLDDRIVLPALKYTERTPARHGSGHKTDEPGQQRTRTSTN